MKNTDVLWPNPWRRASARRWAMPCAACCCAISPGAAVTRVRIEGIQHEFSPIPNVKEDVLDFVLNIKSLKLKPVTGQAGKLYLEKEGEGEVHASDITPSMDFEIVNPDLYLATLSGKNARLSVEMDVELGMGYQTAGGSRQPAHRHHTGGRHLHAGAQGELHYRADAPGPRDQPGKADPRDMDRRHAGPIAGPSAAGPAILVEQLKPMVDYGRASDIDDEKKAIRASIPEDLYNMPVEKLDLSVRAMNCLRRSGINTVGELVSLGEKELLVAAQLRAEVAPGSRRKTYRPGAGFPQSERDRRSRKRRKRKKNPRSRPAKRSPRNNEPL